jgi:hypothetical protein
MPRKLVAIREDQVAALEELAAIRTDEPGNVSAEIREALDKHITRKRRKAKGAST